VEEIRNGHNILVAKPEAKNAIRRPRSRRTDTVKTDIREKGFGAVN
jgi:hypothetical protein